MKTLEQLLRINLTSEGVEINPDFSIKVVGVGH